MGNINFIKTTAKEKKYLKSITNLSGENCTDEKIEHYLISKAKLLETTIEEAQLPEGTARTIIDHYANKLRRIGKFLNEEQNLDQGDSSFLLDQLNSAKRQLAETANNTAGLFTFINQIESARKFKKYQAKPENQKFK